MNFRKPLIILFLCLMASPGLLGQGLDIQGGAFVINAGATHFVIENGHFRNNGFFVAGDSRVTFEGDQNNQLSGFAFHQFHDLLIRKSSGAQFQLLNSIQVDGQVIMEEGVLNLLNSFLSLGNNPGEIIDENNNRYITAQNGLIQKLVNLDQPLRENPGNLGIEISSLQNLGNTLISRGHQAQILAGQGIDRYFQISPSNNINLDARLRLYYLNHEIDGLPELALELWESIDGLNWNDQGIELNSIADNWLEISNLDALSNWTIGVPSVALNFSLNYFRLFEREDEARLEWQIRPLEDIDHFYLEQAGEDLQFSNYRWIPYRNGQSIYSVVLQDLNDDIQYLRLRTNFKDGSYHLSTPIFLERLAHLEAHFFPNPVQDILQIEAAFDQNEVLEIQILSLDGKKLWEEKRLGTELKNGLDLSQLVAGTYLLILESPGKGRQKVVINKN